MDLKRIILVLVMLARVASATAQPVPAPASKDLTSTTCTAGVGAGCLTLTVAGYGTVGVQVTNTFSGTLQMIGSVDRTNFSAVNCTPPNSTNPVTTTTATGTWTCDVAGLNQFQIGFSVYNSGTATVTLQASPAGSARGQAPAGSGGTASAFGSALPANGTAAGFKKSSDSSMQAGTLDDNAYLQVNCKTGCAGASDTTGSSVALGSLNAADTVALAGEGGASFHLAAGTLTGTLTPELSFDGGSTYPVATKFIDNTLTSSATIVLSNPNAAQDISVLVLGGATHARVRVSAYTSGTATGHLTSTTNQMPVVVIGGTLPVTGTVTVTQGTGTNLHAVIDSGSTTAVTQATAGNLNATVVGTGTFATQAAQSGTWNVTNVSGTVTLPTGASTAAKQPALGTAGTASTDVITVQGIASMTKLLVTPDSVALPANQSVNVAQLAGTTTDVNSGNKGNGTLRVVLATDQPQLTAKLLVTPDANSAVNLAQMNGAAVASPDANSYPIVAPAATATASAAASACNVLSAASTNSTNCKNAAGNLVGYELYNTTTTVYYLRMYNASSAPTCSSATGFIRSIPIPPAASAGLVGGAVSNFPPGVNYSTGISFCLTGGSSSTDNTNAATGIFGELRYK